jgi:nucleoid-associated protein YgaU
VVASAAERAELEKAHAQAGALADRLGQGEHPGALRAQLYVARQSLKDPVGSKNNGAIQAAAAALMVIGQAEADNQAQRIGMAAAVAGGVDPRTLDARVTALGRQAEDLEAMRLGIETADLRGLTPDQAAKGVGIIGQMQGIAQQVAGGQDFGVRRKEYQGLVQQLQALRQSPAAAAPSPQPVAPQPGPASQEPAGKPTSYTVKAGDYLSKIAREQLGDPNRWREIVELNKAKYPGLAQNPDLIHPGWTLQLPPRDVSGAPGTKPPVVAPPAPKPPVAPPPVPKPPVAAPPAPKPPVGAPPAPQPPVATPPGPKPPVVAPPAPQPPAAPTDKEAVAWLRANADAEGAISRETLARMPAGPARDALTRNFDTLLFGNIETGERGWTLLNKGDLDRLERAVGQGQGIEAFATELARRVIAENDIKDLTGDGKVDGRDVAAFAEARRKKPGAGGEPQPRPPLTGDARLQADLDAFLAAPENQQAGVLRDTLASQPAYFEAATPAQKARILGLLVQGLTTKKDRQAALKVLEMAEKRGEVLTTLQAAAQARQLGDILSDLGDHSDGVRAAGVLQRAGVYREPAVWQEMDDDAVRGLVKTLGFREPMIGTSEAIGALSEEARKHMIRELLRGNLTWEEHAMARWLNQHNATPVDIPAYNQNNT